MAAQTFYVCQGGDGTTPLVADAAHCWDADDVSAAGNWANPKQVGKVGPGDTVYFMSDGGAIKGTGTATILIGASGDSGSVITLTGDGSAVISGEGATPTVGERYCIYGNGKDYITIDNLEIAYGLSGNVIAKICDHWTFTNNEIHHCTKLLNVGILLRGTGTNWRIAYNYLHDNEDSHAIYLYSDTDASLPSTDILIEYNRIENAFDNGIQFNGVDEYFTNIVIRYNYIANSGSYNILLCTTDGAEIYGNILVNTVADKWEMICLGDDTEADVAHVKNTKIWNNTIYGRCEAALFMYPYFAAATACASEIYNNIFYLTAGPSTDPPNFYFYYGQTEPAIITASDYNLFYHSSAAAYWHLEDDSTKATLALWQAATTYDDHSVDGDPLFTDAANDIFTLGVGSPALGTGTTGGPAYGLHPTVRLSDFGRGGNVTLAAFQTARDMGAYAYSTPNPWVMIYG